MRLNNCATTGEAAAALLPADGLTEELARAVLQALADEESILLVGDVMHLDDQFSDVRMAPASTTDPAGVRGDAGSCSWVRLRDPGIRGAVRSARGGFGARGCGRTIALAVAEGEAESFGGYPTFNTGSCAMGEPASGAPPLVAAGTGAQDRINATGTVTMAKAVLSGGGQYGLRAAFRR